MNVDELLNIHVTSTPPGLLIEWKNRPIESVIPCPTIDDAVVLLEQIFNLITKTSEEKEKVIKECT